MVAALVLAAGESSRMGTPKALLSDPSGRPFVVRIVDTLTSSDIPTVVVVTGIHHSEIAAAVEHVRPVPRVVRNDDPSRGQLSSLLVGLDAVDNPSLEAVLVTLVDVPMTSAETIRQIVSAWRVSGARIVRPAVGRRHGHPVLFDRALFAALRAAPLAEGAKAVLRAHADAILNVPVDDAGCLRDVDTPEEYRALLDSARRES
jgi:molybdenum cofactor cytidylyltransferase